MYWPKLGHATYREMDSFNMLSALVRLMNPTVFVCVSSSEDCAQSCLTVRRSALRATVMYWHRSAHTDPANQWLRQALIREFPRLQARAYDRNGRAANAPRA